MHHLHHFFHPLRLLLAFSLLFSVVPFVFLGWRYLTTRRNRPQIAKADIVYQERFASGASQKNALTQVGGANNCLRLVVTKEILWITSWFPFSVLTAFYDLEHVIPIGRIVSIDLILSFGRAGLLLTYTDDCGANHVLKVFPRNREAFLNALSSSGNFPTTVPTT